MSFSNTVSKNFDFLRWRKGTHKELVKQLNGAASWNQISQFALAQKAPSAYDLKAIEDAASLPVGWCNRDNFAFMDIPQSDYDLLISVLRCRPEVRASLHQFLKSLDEHS